MEKKGKGEKRSEREGKGRESEGKGEGKWGETEGEGSTDYSLVLMITHQLSTPSLNSSNKPGNEAKLQTQLQ